MKKEKNINGKRIEYIDLLRILATIAVIIIHVASQKWHTTDITTFTWNVFNVYDSLVRWAVPIFVMISGALFLSREYTLKNIYCKKILRLVTAFVFWSILYAIMHNHKYGFVAVLSRFFYGNYHLWFIFMIIGLYMLYPILKKISESEKLTEYFLIVWFTLSILLPQISNLLLLSSNEYVLALAEGMANNITNLNLGLGYTGYFILGFYLSQKDISKKFRTMIYIGGLVGFVSTILLTILASRIANAPTETFYTNLNINILFEATCLFVFAKYNFKTNKVINYLSTLCFGVYLVHALVQDNLDIIFGLDTLSFNALLSVPVISIIVIIISFILSAILNKIPKLNKYIV